MKQNELNRTYSIRTLANDPQYFGGYLNMARLNILNINNNVALKVKYTSGRLDNEKDIADSFLGKQDQNTLNWNLIYSITKRFLPFIRVFDFEELPKEMRINIEVEGSAPELIKDFEEMRKILKLIFKEISLFRNDYTHYYSTQEGTNRKITVSGEVKDFLNNLFTYSIEYTKVRMKDVFEESDFKLVEKKVLFIDNNKITTDGLVFLICLFLDKEYAFRFLSRTVGFKNTQTNEFKATREVFTHFCAKLPHDKYVSEDTKQALILDMINELSRCPETLYQVITEEAKRQFRPILDSEKTENIVQSSINPVFWNKLEDDEYETYIENLTRRVRHSNRFPFFAMRYIDEMDILPKYYFQIDLGKLTLTSYNKNLAGDTMSRRVVENTKAFGKLNDFVDEQEILKLVDKDTLSEGFEQFAPHYNADNNKIGLKSRSFQEKNPIIDSATVIADSSNELVPVKLRQPMPDAFISIHELHKVILLEYLEPKAAQITIDRYIGLSRKKILNWQFIESVKEVLPKEWKPLNKWSDSKKDNEDPRLIKAKRNYISDLTTRKTKLNKVLEEHGFNDKQIPTQILDYWLKVKDVDSGYAFADRIKLMREDCKSRLKVMNEKKVNPSVRTPRVGEMATFIAKDIVGMVINEEKKSKITSFYYDKIQECLAFYADDEKGILFWRIIKELKLLEDDGHPFLSAIEKEKPRNTAHFYRIYLEEKAQKKTVIYNKRKRKNETKDISWLERTFYFKVKNERTRRPETKIKLPDDLSRIPYTMHSWERKEEGDESQKLKNWLENVLKDPPKPVDLPTNIFDDAIKNNLIRRLEIGSYDFNKNSKPNELLKRWWESREDSTQEFYNTEREYKVYNQTVRFILNSKEKFEDYYKDALNEVEKRNKEEGKMQSRKQLERVFKKAISGTEKEIRILQDEDRVLLLMVKSLLNYQENSQDVKLSKIEVLLNETINQKLKLRYDKEGKPTNKDENSVLSKTISAEIKRKNYTQLFKYRYDRRLPGLFGYLNHDTIELEELRKQLAAYEETKQQVFDLVFQLEKTIIEKDEDGVKSHISAHKVNDGNIQHQPYLSWLVEKGFITNDEKDFIKEVRNAFSHNSFPKYGDVKDIVSITEDSTFADELLSVYKKIIEKTIELVQGN